MTTHALNRISAPNTRSLTPQMNNGVNKLDSMSPSDLNNINGNFGTDIATSDSFDPFQFSGGTSGSSNGLDSDMFSQAIYASALNPSNNSDTTSFMDSHMDFTNAALANARTVGQNALTALTHPTTSGDTSNNTDNSTSNTNNSTDSSNSNSNVDQEVNQAVDILNQKGYHLTEQDKKDIKIIIQGESSGNPDPAILHDSNWKKGTPSRGIMQVIQPTFDAHKLPGHDNILNPVDNIIAGVRYAIDRYGSLNKVPGVQAVNAGKPYVGY